MLILIRITKRYFYSFSIRRWACRNHIDKCQDGDHEFFKMFISTFKSLEPKVYKYIHCVNFFLATYI